MVARRINFLGNGYEHPSNMCGPLAIRILQDARLLPQEINIKSFWGWNPRVNQYGQRILTENDYVLSHSNAPISNTDFTNSPLYPGDLLYLYAGQEDTFEHIIAISRVDRAGKAYGVSNILKRSTHSIDRYAIEELMLYDPAEPKKGWFAKWSDPSSPSGWTGRGGFDLWRKRVPEYTDVFLENPARRELRKNLSQLVETSQAQWQIWIKEVSGPVLYMHSDTDEVHPASSIKVLIAMLFSRYMEDHNKSVAFLQSGTAGRSFDQLMRAMLVPSEEDAAGALFHSHKPKCGHTRTTQEMGPEPHKHRT